MTAQKKRGWLITGVSSGLGRAIAEAALAAGDTVAGTVRNAADKAAFAELAPGRAFGFILDVRDEASVGTTIEAVEKVLGGIDILVNNAGYGLIGAVEETSLAEIRALFDVNVFGAIAVLQAAIPFMRARCAGHIINVTSVSGLAIWAGTGPYCASKHALEAIGQTLADELAPLGIKVTNVEPGGLRTDFSGRSLAVAQRQIDDYAPTAHLSRQIMAEHAGHEPGDPAKAARAIVDVAGSREAPMHLLLGTDAMFYLGRKLGALQLELAKWAPTTVGIVFDKDQA